MNGIWEGEGIAVVLYAPEARGKPRSVSAVVFGCGVCVCVCVWPAGKD